MDRWDFFVSDDAIHRDWRSSHPVTSLSPLGLGRGEMAEKKKTEERESAFSEYMQRQRDLRALARKAQMNSVRITEFGTALPGEDEKELLPERSIGHENEEQ